MLKKIILGVGAVGGVAVAGVLAMATQQPARFTLERSVEMAARPEVAYAQIEDFHAWNHWSPWDALDPNQVKTFEGEPRGKGAITTWNGNDQVGQGRMTITDVTAPSKVVIDLEFIAPMKDRNEVVFTIAPSGAGSKVTWSMDGPNSFMEKVVGVFMNFEEMVGKDFDKGLASMKTQAEKVEVETVAAEEKAKADAAAAALAAAAVDGAAPVDPAAAPPAAPAP